MLPSAIWWDERFIDKSEPKNLGHELKLTASVDLDDTYVRDLVLQGLARRPEWTVTCIKGEAETISSTASSSDFHWGEYERIDWERVHEGRQFASCYCVRKGLIRKAHLAHNLKKWNAKNAQGRLAKSVPETLVMVLDDIDYFDEALSDVYEVRDMEEGIDVWIAKPSITNQAIGICIFDRVSTLRAALEEHPDLREWVLQSLLNQGEKEKEGREDILECQIGQMQGLAKYIERPLLINARKFHLRAYVLCIGSLRCFVFSEMLALFAKELYSSDRNSFSKLGAHLTNTCHLNRSGSATWQEDEVVQLLSELPQEMVRAGMDADKAAERVEQIRRDVYDVIGCCMDAVSSELTFFTLPNCFELFGFDLLVDEAWNVWLLEANAEPDMKQTGKRLQGVIGSLIEGVLQLVADPLAHSEGAQYSAAAADHDQDNQKMGKSGRWVQVLDKKQRNGEEGGSGIRMQ